MFSTTSIAIAPEQSELGKRSEYDPHYNPYKLFQIPRQIKRDEIGIVSGRLPFFGFDRWNHYEVSWLNQKGKPIVAVAKIVYPCSSPNIIESKSMKLYFNSFNNSKFDSVDVVKETMQCDLSERVGSPVVVNIIPLNDFRAQPLERGFEGVCIDDLDVNCDIYTVEPSSLKTEEIEVEEILFSDLLKSNCLVTNQPDWGSVQICYKGKKINQEGLLQYIVSFRNHNEFHEQCIERIFMDIMEYCKPTELTVHGRYTRRGGLDINPSRSTKECVEDEIPNVRLCRQ